MQAHKKAVSALVESVCVDGNSVVCHFRCDIKDKIISSRVPFEPYDGKIEISFLDMLLHPFQSYNRYYHTPITIYGNDCEETIVLKAFENVAKYFIWNQESEKYIYNYGL